jgi:hypothetical protein
MAAPPRAYIGSIGQGTVEKGRELEATEKGCRMIVKECRLRVVEEGRQLSLGDVPL